MHWTSSSTKGFEDLGTVEDSSADMLGTDVVSPFHNEGVFPSILTIFLRFLVAISTAQLERGTTLLNFSGFGYGGM